MCYTEICSNVVYKSILKYRNLYSSKGLPESNHVLENRCKLEYSTPYSSKGLTESSKHFITSAYSSTGLLTRVKDLQRAPNGL